MPQLVPAHAYRPPLQMLVVNPIPYKNAWAVFNHAYKPLCSTSIRRARKVRGVIFHELQNMALLGKFAGINFCGMGK